MSVLPQVERSSTHMSRTRPARPGLGVDHVERDHLLDRLQILRAIVPAFAQELATARRQAARLRVENRRLLEEVRELQHTRRRMIENSVGGR